MRIAVIDPYIQGIFGQRTHLTIARYLSTTNEVDLYVHKIRKDLVSIVKESIGKANLIYIKEREGNGYEFLYSVNYMYLGLADRSIFKKLKNNNKIKPYDAILLISGGEGAWIANLAKKRKNEVGTLIIFLPVDPPHGFNNLKYSDILEGKGRKIDNLRISLIKAFHTYRLKYFDYVMQQSKWTTEIFKVIFQIDSLKPCVTSVDENKFAISNQNKSEKYIAVPTVSMYEKGEIIVKKLIEDGIPIKVFGHLDIDGVKSLGYVDDATLVEVYGNANATLFLFDYESFGLVPLESLACGTPVVTEDKLGPGAEWKGNKFVNYFHNYDDLLKICRSLINTDLGYADRLEIRHSVRDYFFKNTMKDLNDFITSKVNNSR